MNLGGSLRTAYDRAVRSTVQIGARGAFGSGFIVASGLLITNHHVAQTSRLNVRFHDRKEEEARVLVRSEESDLALLACDTGSHYPLTLAKSKSLELGDLVFAIGHPLGLENALAQGIVSGIDSRENTFLQMDISLAPGNSGGPILNAHGGVVGIATMIAGPGIGLAVRSESVERFMAKAERWRAA